MSNKGFAKITVLWEDELCRSSEMLHDLFKHIKDDDLTRDAMNERLWETLRYCYATLYPIESGAIIIQRKESVKINNNPKKRNDRK